MTDSQSRRLAGPILGFVGGFLILLYGLAEVYIGSAPGPPGALGGLPIYSLGGVVEGGVAGGIIGLLVMIASIGLAYYPTEVAIAYLIIILSVLSVVSVGGRKRSRIGPRRRWRDLRGGLRAHIG